MTFLPEALPSQEHMEHMEQIAQTNSASAPGTSNTPPLPGTQRLALIQRAEADIWVLRDTPDALDLGSSHTPRCSATSCSSARVGHHTRGSGSCSSNRCERSGLSSSGAGLAEALTSEQCYRAMIVEVYYIGQPLKSGSATVPARLATRRSQSRNSQMDVPGLIRVEGGPMRIRSISSVLLAAAPMVIGGMFASGSSALAQSNNGPCSNATLSGDYAGRFAGRILATAVDPERQVTGVTLTHFDDHGNFTSVEHVVFSGFPPPPGGEWTPATGTYTVNEDCTGSSVTHSANSPQGLPQHFVVVDNGNKIQNVVDFGAFASIATKVSGAADPGDQGMPGARAPPSA